MKLEQLKISSSAIKVLEDKKIVSAEALLRKPPLRFFRDASAYTGKPENR